MSDNIKQEEANQQNDNKILSKEKEKELDFFITTPLRSANNLMNKLYSDDSFYETTTYAFVSPGDAKKLFFYGACKEVLKTCIYLMNNKEFLGGSINDKDFGIVEKVIMGSTIDTQTYHRRKMVELLSIVILFDRNTKHDEEYRIYKSAENLDLFLSRQSDFKELFNGKIILNTQHSIDDFIGRIDSDKKAIELTDVWFLNEKKLKNQTPGIFKSKKGIYDSAMLVATPDEKIALGISYGRGYSRASQSIHPMLGSSNYGKEDNDIEHVLMNSIYMSIICMQIMHIAYKLTGFEDEFGLSKIMGTNFEKSEASKSIGVLQKDFDKGDLILTSWTDIAEIIDEETSKYGYKAYKIKYLLTPPLPEYPEDWIEAQNILARILSKKTVRKMFNNMVIEKMSKDVIELWPDVLKQPDEELMKSAKHVFIDLHKANVLIPMLLKSGFLKKTS